MDEKAISQAFIERYDNKNEHEAYGLLPALERQDIINSSRIYPELEIKFLMTLESYLGYLPKPITYFRHGSFVRTLLASYGGGEPEDQFIEEFELHCKTIRNDDMARFQMITKEKYTEKDYKYYDTHLPMFKMAARDRLASFLGLEELNLEFSLDAETFLRQLFKIDIFHRDMPFCDMDFRAATIYKYRETLLLHGEDAANDSPLIAFEYNHKRIKLRK